MEYVEVARSSSERGEIVLRQRHDPDARDASPSALELRVNGVYVMDTFENTSEIQLARLALSQVDHPRRVLVGGLGLGYTALEVLSHPHVEHVQVAEIEDVLVRWFRDGTIPHGPTHLADERLHVTVADVHQLIAEAHPGSYDLIVLDVDNGPDFLVFDTNAALYEAPALNEVRRVLSPGGALAIWSSTRSADLEQTLDKVFGASVSVPSPVTVQDRDQTYWLHCARRRKDDHDNALRRTHPHADASPGGRLDREGT